MHVILPGAPRKVAARPEAFGPGRARKIGIIGASPHSVVYAPWDDPSWEFWVHSSALNAIPWLRADLIWDLHPKHCFMDRRKFGFKDYYQFLQGCPTPIMMQQHYEKIPASVRYPRHHVKQMFPRVPRGSQVAHMVAYALYTGVTHLGFWGVDLSHDDEFYSGQRSNGERWVGIAEGMGVQIVLPPNTPFCQQPTEEYAYDTHSTRAKYEALKKRFQVSKLKSVDKLNAFSGSKSKLRRMITDADFEEAARLRREKQPAWAKAMKYAHVEETKPRWLITVEKKERAQQLQFAGVPVESDLARIPRAKGVTHVSRVRVSPATPAAQNLARRPRTVSRRRVARDTVSVRTADLSRPR
jgi:hypothetical protein